MSRRKRKAEKMERKWLRTAGKIAVPIVAAGSSLAFNLTTPTAPTIVVSSNALNIVEPMESLAASPFMRTTSYQPAISVMNNRESLISRDGSPRPRVKPGELEDSLDTVLIAAYQNASETLAQSKSYSCTIDWKFLAAVSKALTNHGLSEKVSLGPYGDYSSKILTGIDNKEDTDGGLYDGSKKIDHKIGPFAMSLDSWRSFAVDANNDGIRSPHNVYDASLAATLSFCSKARSINNLQEAEAFLREEIEDVILIENILSVYKHYLPLDLYPEVEQAVVRAIRIGPIPEEVEEKEEKERAENKPKQDKKKEPKQNIKKNPPVCGPGATLNSDKTKCVKEQPKADLLPEEPGVSEPSPEPVEPTSPAH